MRSTTSSGSKGKLLVAVDSRRLSSLESGASKSSPRNEEGQTLANKASQNQLLNESEPSAGLSQQTPAVSFTPITIIPSNKDLSHIRKRRNTDVMANLPPIVHDATGSQEYLNAENNERIPSETEEDEDCYIFADSFYFGSYEELVQTPSKSRSFDERHKNAKIIHAFSLKQGLEVPDSDSDDTDSQSSGISKTMSFSSSNVSDCYNSSHLGAFATEDEMRRFEMDEYINLRTVIANEELEQLKLYEFPPWSKRFSSDHDEAKDDQS
ncbi:hypothetical protein C9374_007827 [Naegleria lovaniensis]|uniref:Uncharacterized protein n=1 Tax=Naegleria lovaniensis TaxID=51637 RepID=A0AA88GJJ7_NAELO|nr:uncharacterized protein C9374_007827 [Naegleria lovaniensis]KAG2378679.1 hypothetical protein C9374_007827 [Naegleria lovaniensis]